MRLKSLSATNQRIRRTCVGNILMFCLLTSKVWSFASIKHGRFERQLSDAVAVNYEKFSATNPYHRPHFTGNRSVVVQLFEWKFADIAAECRDFLGPQGYAGVQLSPVLEHTVVKTADVNHPWWERLEVVSYRLASRSGDEAEFWSMSRICNENGVRIYADVVLNHMAAPLHYMGVTKEEDEAEAVEEDDFVVNTLLDTNVNLAQLNYSNVPYTQNDFHKPHCIIMANEQNGHVIRNCQLNGHPDLDHSRRNVQEHIVEMLNKFVDMGVAGFRIDAAKYVWPIDLKNIFGQVKNLSTEFNFEKNTRPFVYYDVFDLGLDTVSKTEYLTYGVVSEYLYAAELSNILRGKVPLSALINWGPALGFLPHEDSLVFIDSHDTQRGMPWELGNNQMLSHKQRLEYIVANVFMLVHPYGGIKRIMSSYYFPSTDINRGPPAEEADEDEIRSPKYDDRKQCTKESGWVCEHRWPQIVNLIKVANYFRAGGNKEESVIYFQTNGPNQVAFCRGRKAFVAINNDVENDFIQEVYGCLEPGMYCDMVTGGKKDGLEECHGKMVEINDQGYIRLALNVADNKRAIDAEEEEQDEQEQQEEEESVEIQSYGIVVIYVESKIKPADKNEDETKNNAADSTQTGVQEETQERGTEDTPSTEDEQDAAREDNDLQEEQQDVETEQKTEPTDEQEEQEGEVETEANVEEPADEEDIAEVKSENQEEENNKKEEIVNEDSNDPTAKEEANEGNEHDLSEENENEIPNEQEDIEIGAENENEETKALEEEDQELGGDSVDGPSEDDKEEPDKDVDEETTSDSGDTSNNQSRNLNEKDTDGTEEQIEKPSAEIVKEDGDISDTVTAKIQDIQTAGIFSKPQAAGNNG